MQTTQSTFVIKREGKTIIKTCLVDTIQRYANDPTYKIVKVKS